jgi:hypothetical protein
MDAVTLTVLTHGIGMLLLIAGGLTALYLGYGVIKSPSSQPGTTATFKFIGLTATAKGAGAVIMITAGVWAYLGVKIAPNLAMDRDGGTKIYSFQTDEGKVTAPAFKFAKVDRTKPWNDTKTLAVFKNYVAANKLVGGKPIATIDGHAAVVEGNDASVGRDAFGGVEVSTMIEARGRLAQLRFAAVEQAGAIAFIPKEVFVREGLLLHYDSPWKRTDRQPSDADHPSPSPEEHP